MAQDLGHRDLNSKDWTVLIFMAADNDLTPFALWDIYEMERKIKGMKNLGASTDKINVVVELDTIRKDGSSRFLIEQTNLEYDQSVNKDFFDKNYSQIIKSTRLDSHVDESKPQKERLFNFLEWGITNYPAEKIMLVIWGHGQGFIGEEYHLCRKEL